MYARRARSQRRLGLQLLPTADLNTSASVDHQSLESPFGSVGRAFPGFTRDEHDYTLGPAASWEIDLFGGLRRGAPPPMMRPMPRTRHVSACGSPSRLPRLTPTFRSAATKRAWRKLRARSTPTPISFVWFKTGIGRRSGRARDCPGGGAFAASSRQCSALRIGLEAQLNRLDVLMGVQPGAYAQELSAPGAIPSIPAIGGADQPLDVLRRRPDVIAAERRLAASNERIGQALSDYYPKISLSGALGVDSLSGLRLFTSDAFTATGAGALRWRLFDFGKVDAEVKQARGANAEALASYRQTVLKAAADVEDALITLSQTQAYVTELQAEVTL